jgi:hypothetical protein
MGGHRQLGIGREMLLTMGEGQELEIMKEWRLSEGVSVHPGFAEQTEYQEQQAQWRVSMAR